MLEQFIAKITALLPKSRRPAAAEKIRRILLNLEALEDRFCPSGPTGPDTGGGGGNTDTLIWKPQNGNLSNTAGNWFDQTTDQQVNIIPTTSNPVIFDGTVANKAIEINGQFGAKSLTVQGGYQNTMTIDYDMSVPTEANDTINAGCALTLVSVPGSGGIELENGNSFNVLSGGTLNLTDEVGATAGAKFLNATTGVAGEYLNNAGTVSWNGTAVSAGNPSIVDFLYAPILNTGAFKADGGIKGNTTLVPGTLQISGQDPNNTSDLSFYQTSGSLNLTNMAIVQLLDEYKQTGGTLTSDSSTCTLESGLTGAADINIAGGKVVVDNIANSVGTLKFLAGTVEINGEIDVNGLATGGKSTQCDLLDCSNARVTLGTSSDLYVATTGIGTLGTGNQWIVMKYASITGNWATTSYPTGMMVSTGATQVLVSN